MKLTQPQIKRMVTGFSKVVPKNESLPALLHVLVRVDEQGHAEAIASNLEETLVFRFDSPACESFLLPFAELKRLAADLGRGDCVVIEAEEGGVLAGWRLHRGSAGGFCAYGRTRTAVCHLHRALNERRRPPSP